MLFQLQPKQSEATAVALIDEMNSLKEQIKNLQDALFCTEEENQQLQLEYQNKLNVINDLKMEIEDWKSINIHDIFRINMFSYYFLMVFFSIQVITKIRYNEMIIWKNITTVFEMKYKS